MQTKCLCPGRFRRFRVLYVTLQNSCYSTQHLEFSASVPANPSGNPKILSWARGRRQSSMNLHISPKVPKVLRGAHLSAKDVQASEDLGRPGFFIGPRSSPSKGGSGLAVWEHTEIKFTSNFNPGSISSSERGGRAYQASSRKSKEPEV